MSFASHCQTLGIEPSMKDDFRVVKNAFYKKITAPFTYRSDRAKYNLAFQYLCNRMFNTQPNSEEKEIIDAVYKGDIKFLEKKLKQNPNLANFRRPFSNYPLIYLATKSGHYDVVELVLKSGCNLDFSKDRSTPMHCAAFYGFRTIIPLLFQYGISTKIKNFADDYPEEQAFDDSIRQLILSSRQNVFAKLVENLIDLKQAVGVLNLNFNDEKGIKNTLNEKPIDVKKIILKEYFDDHSQYVNGFHGTRFEALESICLNGLRAAGQKVNGKQISVIQGHVQLGVKIGEYQNWSKAIFVSPSIYYAGDPVYSKTFMIGDDSWNPIVQVKVKKNTYSTHQHTFMKYHLKDMQPGLLEYRVQSKKEEEAKPMIFRNQDYKNVKVVALLFIRTKFLFNETDYSAVTNFILNSQCQIDFNLKNKDKFKQKKKYKQWDLNTFPQVFQKYSFSRGK